MDITGKLIKILPNQEGDSARGHWVRGGFVIETDEMYPKMVAFTLFGEDRLAMINGLAMNSPVTVTFSPESREYNERWYTDLRCIRVMPAVAAAAAPVAGQPVAAAPVAAPAAPATPFASVPPTMPTDDNGDLPF